MDEGRPALPAIVTAVFDGDTLRATAVDGRFPDWQRIVPRKASAEPATYNPQLMLSILEAFRLYRDRSVKAVTLAGTLVQNGKGPGIVHDGAPGALGLIMPMREAHEPDTLPATIADTLGLPAPVAPQAEGEAA